MSRENVEALRRVYEKWRAGNFWTPEIFDPRVQAIWTSNLFDLEPSVGPEALGESLKEWLGAWKDARMEAERFREAGDSVVVSIRWSAIARSTGIPFEGRAVHVWTMRNAKAIRLEGFSTEDEALEAVGLRE
jgi:hypothetical protein